ncbi:MAG: pyridoxamine 5'-phosphate oxidase family protein [Clostridium sp.]|nr:pyridoxamine 5'-phosphate oxidase family protein [Clostridium sp.]
MDQILKFITEAKTFYISTVDGDKPRVRPFGFIMNYENKLYLSTASNKNVCRQLAANPNCEICAMSAEGKWMRLSAKAIFDTRKEVKEKAFEVMPELKGMYKSAQNPDFTTFYLDNIEGCIYSFTEKPQVISL